MRRRGFTLIELLVVMAALGLLLSLAAPRYIEHADRARETVLKHNLAAIRTALERYRGDRGLYPEDLAELVRQRYLREIPLDPITDRSDSWVLLTQPGQPRGIYDVRSAAPGNARDGSAYAIW